MHKPSFSKPRTEEVTVEKPKFKREEVTAPITGEPDPDPKVEESAVEAFRAIEDALHRHFNVDTGLNKVRGVMEAFGVTIEGMPPRARNKISDAQHEGYRLATSYVLASQLMGDLGPRYVARIGQLLIPVAEVRITMKAETDPWKRHLRTQ